MLGITLIVLVIAEHADSRSSAAFEQSARRALGADANLQIEALSENPPDEAGVARAADTDGVVELSWTADGTKARLHCYLTHEQRWVDREISFGAGTARPERESAERGRLLGFAVATMFTEDKPPPTAPESQPAPEVEKPVADGTRSSLPQPTTPERPARPAARSKSVDVAGIASAGLHGTAAGLGAAAAVRFSWFGPLSARLFVAARSGNIPKAQASTRTVLLGSGLAFAALPQAQRFELDARLDGFAYYFDASHLSADDSAPDTRGRWLPGADLLVEGGVRLGDSTSLFLGGGIEAVLGRTDVYTHGIWVAVVPPFRTVGEFGFRARF